MTTYTLVPQTYGIAMAQGSYGGPLGIWIECTTCDRADKIAKAPHDMPNAEAAKILRTHGWSGIGHRMMRARCPTCAGKAK